MPESVQKFSSYGEAAKAACKWVEKGGKPKDKVDLTKLRVYHSTVGPYKGRVVGVGLLRDSGVIEDIVRIDCDDTGKGIHFNAKNLSNTKDKLAAVIKETVAMKPYQRGDRFDQHVKALENLDADTIWEWWKTGKKPGVPW